MTDVQTALGRRVASLEGSRRAQAFLLLAAALLGGVTGSHYTGGFPALLRGDDPLEYAVMARRLASGEGFTTGVVFPATLHLGADAEHPAVRLPPLWPLALAGPFALLGASEEIVRATVVAGFAATVAAAAALALAEAGLVAGALVAVAVATSPPLLTTALDSGSEVLLAALLTLAWLACARGTALAVGACCGLVYLTRYGGIVLLPVALFVVAARRREPPMRALGLCLAGFLLVAAPWWIRNQIVAGSPFYSLQNLTPWVAPGPTTSQGGSLLFQQQPDLASSAALDPWVKLRSQLGMLLQRLAFPSANLAAFVGLLLGIVRGDRLCAAWACGALLTLVCVALVLPQGSALAPWIPGMIALGAVAWLRHGGRLRAPALALLLLAGVLPSFPWEMPDLDLLRVARDDQRLLHERHLIPDPAPPRAALRACLSGRPVVLAQFAPRLAWEGDAVALHAPSDPEAFWRIVREQPVAFAYVTSLGPLDPERFDAEFEPRPECAPHLYARRSELR